MSNLYDSPSSIIEYMSPEEIQFLCFHLQRYNGIFNQFINIGTPVFDTSLPTAAVFAEKQTGQFLYMRINPEFWKSLTLIEKLFVIAHECLHIVLYHLIRFTNYENQNAIAKAIDIVVNHMCVEKLGFRRKDIDPNNQYCWTDTIFEDASDIPTNETVDYYYDLIDNNKEPQKHSNNSGKVMDKHIPIKVEDIKKFMEKMDKVLTDDEKQYLNKIAGNDDKFEWKIIKVKPSRKKKWETVIKRWTIKTIGYKENPKEQWARLNRRITLLKTNCFLPSDMETDEPLRNKNKINVDFYLDVSGSCHHLGERFFKAAKSLPYDKFNVRLFCFHTQVHETDTSQDKLIIGSATRFDIIENDIQLRMRRENIEYPKAVFIITDGEGTNVTPEYPERWHWFLSNKYLNFIPKKSNWYDLNDYE